MTQLGIEVQREKIREKTLKSKGILRTEMRFAKGQFYMFLLSNIPNFALYCIWNLLFPKCMSVCMFLLKSYLWRTGLKPLWNAWHENEWIPVTLKGQFHSWFHSFFNLSSTDSSYMSFYSSQDPPTVIELGQPVYVEVFVLKHEDADLTLLLEDCWATPTEDPHDPQRWDLLVKGWAHCIWIGRCENFWNSKKLILLKNLHLYFKWRKWFDAYLCMQSRCPFTGDSHRTVVLPVVSSKELTHPSLHKWFVVKLFSFVKSPTSENQVSKIKSGIFSVCTFMLWCFSFIMRIFSYRYISTVI